MPFCPSLPTFIFLGTPANVMCDISKTNLLMLSIQGEIVTKNINNDDL
jgi:hypothetical protein